jgi:hypothetical protein
MSFVSNPDPPEVSNDSGELSNKLFGEKNIGHVVHWDRRKNRFYEFESRCMRKLICFVCSEFGFEYVNNEVIGCCSILAWKNERVAKVDEIGVDI